MLTKEQYDLLKAKKPEELTAEEKAGMVEYEAQNAAGRENGNEHMIPKSRFDEVLKAKKDLEDRISAIEKANKDAEERRLIEANKFQELADKRQQEIEVLKPKAAVAEEAEKTLSILLEAQKAELPESYRVLIPTELTTQQQLSWIARNKSLLMKPAPFDIGAGQLGGLNNQEQIQLTPEQLAAAKRTGVKPEEYAKHI